MAWRTNEDDVRSLVDSDLELSLAPFIDTASALTDELSSADTAGTMGVTMLKQVEMYLAAHFYAAMRDPQYTSKSTSGASASFQGQTGQGFDSTYWGQTAKRLDLSGFLAKLDLPTRPKATLTWLGKPVSSQTDYEDRD